MFGAFNNNMETHYHTINHNMVSIQRIAHTINNNMEIIIVLSTIT